MGENGWTFLAEDGATGDTLYGLDFCTRSTPRPIRPIPAASPCRCCGTRSSQTIVSNESSEIIRMLNSAFDEWGDASLDFYPERLRGEIDRVNALVYPVGQQRRLPRRLRHHASRL